MILEIECLFLYCESKETAVSEHTKFIFAMFLLCLMNAENIIDKCLKIV